VPAELKAITDAHVNDTDATKAEQAQVNPHVFGPFVQPCR
jgi:hypothetical protein